MGKNQEMINLYKITSTNTTDDYYFLAEDTKQASDFFEELKRAYAHHNYYKQTPKYVVPDKIKDIILLSQSVYIKEWSYVASDGMGKICVFENSFKSR